MTTATRHGGSSRHGDLVMAWRLRHGMAASSRLRGLLAARRLPSRRDGYVATRQLVVARQPRHGMAASSRLSGLLGGTTTSSGHDASSQHGETS
ncbi:hypothetical protein [Amycolatopsis circi]|uniref:hypothetical protein n=1 Tax=Amycolatopsis circi TaxID=871959 RepID=UPI0013BE9EE0|nr:hypothetical protein [Amycolatopsis circi]